MAIAASVGYPARRAAKRGTFTSSTWVLPVAGAMDAGAVHQTVQALIDGCCEKRNLQALRLVLPAYPPGALTDDWGDLLIALKQVRISCRDDLELKEMETVIALIHQVERTLER